MFCSVIYITGTFGIVYKAYYTPEENTVTEVAVKTIKCVLLKFSCITQFILLLFIAFSSSTAEDFIKECNISKKFDHPNVLSLIGVCIIPKESVPLMVMPFMHHGDVKSFLKSKRGNDIKVEEFPLVTWLHIQLLCIVLLYSLYVQVHTYTVYVVIFE